MESRKTSMGGANTEVSENAPTDTNARTSNEPVEFDGSVSEEARRQMIAQAAYFIAERNGFDGMHQLDDLLAAEVEVNARLGR